MTKSDIRLLEANFRTTGRYELAALCVQAIEGNRPAWEKIEEIWQSNDTLSDFPSTLVK
jgi:hypothetical protein